MRPKLLTRIKKTLGKSGPSEYLTSSLSRRMTRQKTMVANPIHLTLNLTINMRKTVISCLKTPTDPLTKGMSWRWIGGHKKPFLNVELQQLLKRQHQEPLKLKSKRKGSPRKTCHSSINQKII